MMPNPNTSEMTIAPKALPVGPTPTPATITPITTPVTTGVVASTSSLVLKKARYPTSSDKHVRARAVAQKGEWTRVAKLRDERKKKANKNKMMMAKLFAFEFGKKEVEEIVRRASVGSITAST